MFNLTAISNDVLYVGASDRRIAKFENAYPVNGMSYNAYLVLDEKTVLLDTCDQAVEHQFFENVEKALDGRPLDYLIINHMEPDHCATLGNILNTYPDARIFGSTQVKRMIGQFFPKLNIDDRFEAAKEGQELNTGKHTFRFLMAPMVHWPETMVTFDLTDGILYSADAFGVFGALSGNLFEDQTHMWRDRPDEARRYYANIVGKFGPQVQNLLKKINALDVQMLCPLHGPVLRGDLTPYLEYYQKWSSYTPEENSVLIVYGSIYGGTENAAEILAAKLAEKGVSDISLYDVSKTHYSRLVSAAFRYRAIVFASVTLDTGLFPPMDFLLSELAHKNLQNRTVGLIENGTWGPMSNKFMTAHLEGMKNITVLDEKVTMKSTVSEDTLTQIQALADSLYAALQN